MKVHCHADKVSDHDIPRGCELEGGHAIESEGLKQDNRDRCLAFLLSGAEESLSAEVDQ